jgi:hypothetical protein
MTAPLLSNRARESDRFRQRRLLLGQRTIMTTRFLRNPASALTQAAPRAALSNARRLAGFLFALLIGLSFLLPAASQAADQTPNAFLLAIYKQYVGKNAPGVQLDYDSDYLKYFTPAMAKIIVDDSDKASKVGDVPTLDGDPFIGHQDWDITNLKITVDDMATDKTTGTVTFKNIGKPETITVDLLKVDGAWKIDDVHWVEDSLRGIFKQ